VSNEPNPCRVITPMARLSYPNLFVATAVKEGDEKKFSCELIFGKGADLTKLRAAAKAAATKKWPSNMPKNLRSPFRNGDAREGKKGYDDGVIFIGARDKSKPEIVIGREKLPCEDPSKVYGGCYVIASVTAFGYDQTGNKGVAFALNSLWVIKDGEPFGSRKDAQADFADTDIDPEAFGSSDEDSFEASLFGDLAEQEFPF